MPGKQANKEPSEAITIRIPQPLFIEVKTLLLDPKSGRTKYGAMSSLVERLLREWLRDVRDGQDNIPEMKEEEGHVQ